MVLEIEKWRQKWLSDPTEVTCSYWQRGGSLGQLQSSGYLLNILLPHREEGNSQGNLLEGKGAEKFFITKSAAHHWFQRCSNNASCKEAS